MNKTTRNGLRMAFLSSIATVFLFGQGIALATARDDPTGTITDVVDDTTDPITDVVADTTDPVTDTVEGASDPVTDTVDDTTDPITDVVDDTTDPVNDIVGGADDPVTDTVGGAADPVTDTVNEGSGTIIDAADPDAVVGPITRGIENPSPVFREQRGYGGSLATALSATDPSDLDELAQGGNDIVQGSGGTACVGSARVVCLDLVGGLGPLGLLFRAADEAGDVVSSFTDALASTGIDLLGAAVIFVTLTVTGIMLISIRRRTGRAPTRGRRSPVRM